MKVLATAVAALLLVGMAQASGDDDLDDLQCEEANCMDLGAGIHPCSDCSGYVTCSAGGPPFISSYIKCQGTTKYNSKTKTCTEGVTGCTHNKVHDHDHSCDCQKLGAGTYPCPDCDGYHICTPAINGGFIDDYIECSSGERFNFPTKTCTEGSTATNAQCDAAHDGNYPAGYSP